MYGILRTLSVLLGSSLLFPEGSAEHMKAGQERLLLGSGGVEFCDDRLTV